MGDYVFLPNIRKDLENAKNSTEAVLIKDGKGEIITLGIVDMTSDERDILLCGGLINYYSKK